MISERNFLNVWRYQSWNARTIPCYYPGEQFQPTLWMSQGATTAPSYLSEAELISRMDEHEIGTDATIAEHIKKVLERSYVEKRNDLFHPMPLGRTLLRGYQRMGFDLGRPAMRAQMERDMKQIAIGQKSRPQVLGETVEMMRALYRKAAASLHHLRAAAGEQFRPVDASRWRTAHLADGSAPECGKCTGPMQLRVKPEADGARAPPRALCCPRCNEVHMVPHAGELRAHPHRCPLCKFQVLNVSNPEKGTSHTVCPHCFKKAPPHASGGVATDMRCFGCAAQCTLAGGSSMQVRSCPRCASGKVVVKSSKDGKGNFFSCSAMMTCSR